MKKEIPIRNVYFLLSFAWGHLDQGENACVGSDSFSNASNLMARLMDISFRHLRSRGLAKEYVAQRAEFQGVKGHLCLSDSMKAGKLLHGKTVCEFDDHGLDHILNQVIKSSLTTLVRQPDLDKQNIVSLKSYIAQLDTIPNIELCPKLFDRLKLRTHTRNYHFIIELCRLISQTLTLSSSGNEIRLLNFLEDSLQMDRIFEKFIRNFYAYNLRTCKVSSPVFHWNVTSSNDQFLSRVPQLRTDVVIDEADSRLIIDAKFYVEALKQSYGGRFKFRRDHLSQLMEYIRTSKRDFVYPTRGMLLYPTVGEDIDESGEIEGFDIRIATIDLSKDWRVIEAKLLSLVGAKKNAFVQQIVKAS